MAETIDIDRMIGICIAAGVRAVSGIALQRKYGGWPGIASHPGLSSNPVLHGTRRTTAGTSQLVTDEPEEQINYTNNKKRMPELTRHTLSVLFLYEEC